MHDPSDEGAFPSQIGILIWFGAVGFKNALAICPRINDLTLNRILLSPLKRPVRLVFWLGSKAAVLEAYSTPGCEVHSLG